MSKAVFFNFPTHGCINSLLGTVKELVSRGERIIYYCTEEFREKIEQTGSEFRPYRGKVNTFEIINDNMFMALKSSIEMTADKFELHLDDVRNENPDYIIHDSLCTWGKHIAATLKLPVVNLMHSYPMTRSSLSPDISQVPLLVKAILYKIKNSFNSKSAYNMFKKKYGIKLSMADTFLNIEDLNIIYTSSHMAPDLARSEDSFYFVGPSLFFKENTTDFPFNELEGKKVIYISLGTLHNNNPEFYRTCFTAFGSTDYLVVMSTGNEVDYTVLEPVPENFILRPSVPQQKLLNYVDLFITHSGMNSVNESTWSGVPMVLIPHQFEQKLIAQRVESLGMGILLDKGNIRPTELKDAVERIFFDAAFYIIAEKYSSIFKEEEKVSHIRAADRILKFKRDSAAV
jgi:MGT family glycosyltransferase